MFSLHRDVEHLNHGAYYSLGWNVVPSQSIWALAGAAQNFAISHCIWRHGRRRKDEFEQAHWIGLDFDEGTKIEEAITRFSNNVHIIATSKSHQKEKNGIMSDRFHVFLKLSQPVTTAYELEQTARLLISVHAADPACSDAARFFWPCLDLVSVQITGRKIDPVKQRNTNIEEIFPKTTSDVENDMDKKMVSRYHKSLNKGLPPHVIDILKTPPGGRNPAIYRASKDLSKCGHTCRDILEIVDEQGIAKTKPVMDRREIVKTIQNAASSVKKK